MRWTHGSRRAGNVGRAIPPNFPFGRGREMGPQEIPAGLSGAYGRGALSAYREFHTFGVNQLSVGACLYRLFISSKSMEDTEL